MHGWKKTLEAICKVIEKFDSSTDISTVTIYKEELEKAWHDYHDGYVKIEVALTGKRDDDLKEYLNEFGAWHDIFLSSRIKVLQCIASANIQFDAANSSASSLNHSMTAETIRPNFKLPAIKIRTFTGRLEDWPEFKATCASV